MFAERLAMVVLSIDEFCATRSRLLAVMVPAPVTPPASSCRETSPAVVVMPAASMARSSASTTVRF